MNSSRFTVTTHTSSTYTSFYLLCSFLLGLSPWTCLRGRQGDGWGNGRDDTSWVCNLYQCGWSSNKAVSSSIRIWAKRQPERGIWTMIEDLNLFGGQKFLKSPVLYWCYVKWIQWSQWNWTHYFKHALFIEFTSEMNLYKYILYDVLSLYIDT